MKSIFITLILILCAAHLSCSAAEKPEGENVRKDLPSREEIAKLPADGGDTFNRLIHETSPYLRQHARNPVDWYPWGPEAFARARKEDKPIFLSVGYSSCHWCHVMEHESFEVEEVADVLNEKFICVKVDREERPDVDQIYMNATQLLTGRGGWPNSVFMDAAQRPFFCGTYFRKPDFINILNNIHKVWTTDRARINTTAGQISEALEQMAYQQLPAAPTPPDRDAVTTAVQALRSSFDQKHGGFGGAPKFPPHQSLALLLSEYAHAKDEALMEMANVTLMEMAQGGIHDHVGGGFHRYATDAIWFLPHFEKMLYDNGQLSRVYAEAYKVTGNAWYKHVARRINDWVLRDMQDPAGGFWSAYDADSEGEEGKYYLWGRKELVEILGEDAAKSLAEVYNAPVSGNYHEEATGERKPVSILHLKQPWSALPDREALDQSLEKLRKVRDTRVWPALDDKVLTAWNGLMIGGLAYGSKALDEPRYLAAAEKAADFMLTKMRKPDGRMYTTFRDGQAKLNAYLDDYAFLADGLMDLYDATGEKRWLNGADQLMQILMKDFYDETHGGFYFTAEDHEDLLTRNKDPFDGAIPSGNGIATKVLIRLAKALDKPAYAVTARHTIDTFASMIAQSPRGAISFIQAIALYYDSGFGEQEKPAVAAAGVSEPDATKTSAPVKADTFLSALRVAPGSEIGVAVRLTIDPHWHVNANPPTTPNLKPTLLAIEAGDGLASQEVIYPAGADFGDPPDVLQVYDGTVWLKTVLKAASDAAEGAREIALTVHYQSCDDKGICLLPAKLELKIPVSIAKDAAPGERHPAIFK
jgi:uncharacterized protein